MAMALLPTGLPDIFRHEAQRESRRGDRKSYAGRLTSAGDDCWLTRQRADPATMIWIRIGPDSWRDRSLRSP